MRFDIELQINNMRCLRGLFNTLLKVLFSSKEKASIFLVYFLQPKQIRFLVHSDDCMAILAIDNKIIDSNKSSGKDNAEILVIESKDGEAMLQSLCELLEKQGGGNVTIALSKDKCKPGEEPFRSLNLSLESLKYRNQIFKPLYDPETIINHQWLNGCAAAEWRRVEFDIDTEQLLNMLRILVRMKEISNFSAIVSFHFGQLRMRIKLVASNQPSNMTKFFSEGIITSCACRSSAFKGTYTYSIHADNAAKVYQLFLGKSSGSRLFVDSENRIVFTYYQEGVFESQVLLKKWMVWQKFEAQNQQSSRPKLET